MNLMNNGQMDRGNENPTQHLPWLRKTTKKPSQVGRYRDLNPGPPECESRALPWSHLARSISNCYAFCRVTVHFYLLYSFVNRINVDPLFLLNGGEIYTDFSIISNQESLQDLLQKKNFLFFFCRCSISPFYLLSTFRCYFSSFFHYRGSIPFSESV